MEGGAFFRLIEKLEGMLYISNISRKFESTFMYIIHLGNV